jgi:two-component system sensor histidine kinase UhpB
MAHTNNLNLLAKNGSNRIKKRVENERGRIAFQLKLRPETLDELGVLEAIRGLAQEFERGSRISCQTYLHVDSSRLNRDLSIMLFWIVKESLAHVVRHSFATQVEIYLEDIDNALFLGINDNGKESQGAKSKRPKSLEINGIRERVLHLNGKFDIQSKEKEGTMVSILIPVEGELFYQETGR